MFPSRLEVLAMVPLLVLSIVTAALRLAGSAGVDSIAGWQPALRGGLAAMLVLTASAHFGSRRPDLVAMVPARLPARPLLVTTTGIVQVALAVALLLHAIAPAAGVALAGLLVVMFPANIRAAREHLAIGGRVATRLVPRTLAQLVFIGAALAVAA